MLSKSTNYQNVRDHCHYTGKYTGAAHSICSSKFNERNDIPIAYHIVLNYDYHFLIK